MDDDLARSIRAHMLSMDHAKVRKMKRKAYWFRLKEGIVMGLGFAGAFMVAIILALYLLDCLHFWFPGVK